MPVILQFNGLRFTRLGLPLKTGTIGFFCRHTNGVSLCKPSGDLEAFVVSNQRQGHFVVSATNRAGVPHYFFSTSESTEMWLGLTGKSISAEHEAVKGMNFIREGQPENVDLELVHA